MEIGVNSTKRIAGFFLFLGLTLCLSCGYHLLGSGMGLPKSITTLAVPPFERQVTILELDQRVTEAVRAEIARRAKIRIQAERDGADAVLMGAVTGYSVIPLSYDSTGRANRYQVSMTAKVKLVDSSGKVLYESEGYRFVDNYQRSGNPGSYVNEEQVAYDAVARDFAAGLVGRLMESDIQSGAHGAREAPGAPGSK